MTIPTELYSIQGDRVRLHLHAGQQQVWKSKRRTIAMIAGTQSGKTSFGPWWLKREIDSCGAGDYLVVTSSFDLLKLKLLPELLKVYTHILGIGRYWAGDKVIELKNPATGEFEATNASDPMWSRIILRSASAESGLESATAKACWADEAGQDDFPLSAYEAIMRRLSLSMGRMLITTTPYNLGWLKQQIFDRWQKGDSTMDVIQYASTLNPNFPREEFEAARERLPGWKFRMFYMGLFERPAGLIYSDFIDARREKGGHKVESFEIPHEWPHYVGIDPGAPNMASWWMTHDITHDIYYVYRVTMEGKKSTREHAEDFKNYARRNQYNVVLWTVGAKSEEQQRLDFKEHIPNAVEPPIHDVEAGIDRIISLLRQHRIFFFEDDGFNGMDGLFDEFATYSRVLDDNGDATEKIKNKEKYHRLDSGRYCLASTSVVYEDAGEISYPEPYTFSNSPY